VLLQVTSNKTTPQPLLRVTQLWFNYSTGIGSVISVSLTPACASAQQLCMLGNGSCTLAVSSNHARTAQAPFVCCPVDTIAVAPLPNDEAAETEVGTAFLPVICAHTAAIQVESKVHIRCS
jgi:hypothetical protein